MTVITKLIVEQAARSIASFLTTVTPETKKGNHPILLTGGVDVEVELKAGLEDKLVIIARVANCIVYRDKLTKTSLYSFVHDNEFLHEDLVHRIVESLYDNALIGDFSLMKLISAVSNRHVQEVKLQLPAGYTVDLKADDITLFDHRGNQVKLLDIRNNDFPVSPALCIPKTITTDMVDADFKPFVI